VLSQGWKGNFPKAGKGAFPRLERRLSQGWKGGFPKAGKGAFPIAGKRAFLRLARVLP
jgi:hypothetical protein